MKAKILSQITYLTIISLIIILLPQCKKDNNKPSGTLKDIEGNVYNTVIIDGKEWMAENLRSTQYRDGSPIDFPGSDNLLWENNTQGAYAWPDNDEGNKNIYGALYNWYAVNNEKGLCPVGWRVATSQDWSQLINYIGEKHGVTNEIDDILGVGNKLKSCRQKNSPLGSNCDTSLHPRWDFHDTHFGTDDHGFAALPGGDRTPAGLFESMGAYGFWWTSNEADPSHAAYRYINYDFGRVFGNNYHKNYGLSVRCLKN